LAALLYETPKKRRAFFSFHFDDIMRVNVVRNAWRFAHPDDPSFTDSSLWESRKLEGKDALKELIRGGVSNTSAVCVLIGSETWHRPWVRYEIARSVIDERGLLAVHINSIRHHQTKVSEALGYNPLDWLGVGKVFIPSILAKSEYYLFEKHALHDGFGRIRWEWRRYPEYTRPVKLPPWLGDPDPGYLMPLSAQAPVYDFAADDGHRNLGIWIDAAAQRAGR